MTALKAETWTRAGDPDRAQVTFTPDVANNVTVLSYDSLTALLRAVGFTKVT